MPTFKPKNLKKIVLSKKNITTVDSKHREIVEDINNTKENELPQLINEKKELNHLLKVGNITIDKELEIKEDFENETDETFPETVKGAQ